MWGPCQPQGLGRTGVVLPEGGGPGGTKPHQTLRDGTISQFQVFC